jgi:hypothetical protein
MFVRLLVAVSLFLISATLLSAEIPPQKEVVKAANSLIQFVPGSEEKKAIEEKVSKYFVNEAKIDTAKKEYAIKKYLDLLLCYDEVCIVSVRIQEIENGSAADDAFDIYSIDLKNGNKEKILAKPIYHLTFVQQALFEKKAVKDLVYTYFDCWECSPGFYLLTLYFDGAKRRWLERPHEIDKKDEEQKEQGMLLEYREGTYDFSCKFRIEDVAKDGLDDIVTWCRDIEHNLEDYAIISDEETFYVDSVKKGAFVSKKVSDKKKIAKIKKAMCKQMKEKNETSETLKCE